MRRIMGALGCSTALALFVASGANAFPSSAPAIKGVAETASPLQQVQYYERYTRHGVIKCYRDFVIGRYRCHRYGYW